MVQQFRRGLAAWVLAAVLAGLNVFAASQPASAQSGRVELEIFKAGFIVGVSGGSGTLFFQGRSYPLSVGGVSLGATIGAAKAELIGSAFNLRSPSDIAGTYTAVGAGVAIAGGGSVAKLQNSRGVVLELQGRQIGLEFSIDLSGMSISMR